VNNAHNLPDVVSLVGVLVFLAGIHLLWQSRRDILGWVEDYVRLLRANMRRVGDPGQVPVALENPRRGKKSAARIALGFFLAFCVAPTLITLGLVF
jgi:hypothetical protein